MIVLTIGVVLLLLAALASLTAASILVVARVTRPNRVVIDPRRDPELWAEGHRWRTTWPTNTARSAIRLATPLRGVTATAAVALLLAATTAQAMSLRTVFVDRRVEAPAPMSLRPTMTTS